MHPFKRGAWTEDECDMLVDLVQRSGKKWASIQVKLNRSADSCRDKYREMGDDLVKGRWKVRNKCSKGILLLLYFRYDID